MKVEFEENDLKRNGALVSSWCLFFPSLTQPAHSARATSLPPSLRLRSPRRSEERGKAKVAVVVAATATAVATSAAEMGTLRAMEREGEREAGNEMEEGRREGPSFASLLSFGYVLGRARGLFLPKRIFSTKRARGGETLERERKWDGHDCLSSAPFHIAQAMHARPTDARQSQITTLGVIVPSRMRRKTEAI